MLGEHAVIGAVEVDEALAEGEQRAGLQEALDEVAPAERDAVAADGGLQHVGVAVEGEPARRAVGRAGDGEPVLPGRPALVGPHQVEQGQPAPVRDRSAPAAPNLSTASTTSLKAAWRAPTNDGGLAVTDYDLRWREFYATTWTELDDTAASTATRATITGLAAGQTYEVQVRAQNAAGHGAWSASARGATAALGTVGAVSLQVTSQCSTCPAVPTATARPGPGAGDITVVWEPGSEAGRPAVIQWKITRRVGSSAEQVLLLGAHVRYHTFNLVPGSEHSFVLSALDAGATLVTETTSGPVRAPLTAVTTRSPTIKKVGLVSLPTHDADRDGINDTYVRDDRIVIGVTFGEAMTVDATVSHNGLLPANPGMDGRTPRRRRAGRTSRKGAVSPSACGRREGRPRCSPRAASRRGS